MLPAPKTQSVLISIKPNLPFFFQSCISFLGLF
jgi:hypothetical protein